MTDTLTESFCERCGTRYEFSAPTRLNPLRKTRGFIGGLKNYLTSQDEMGDSMRDSMRQQEETLAAAQLEAFHESFNFCIDCRQYTCVNCWNDDAGRCRSCAPVPGTDDLAERLAASVVGHGAVVVAEPALAADDVGRRLGLESWPTSDLPTTASTNDHLADLAWPATDAQPEPTAPEPEPEPIAAEAEPEPEPEPIAADVEAEPEPETPRPLRVASWDADGAYEVRAPEPEPEPEPIAAEVEVEPEPEPIAAEVEPEPEPEPIAAEVEVEVEVEPQPEPIAAAVEVEVEPETAPPVRIAPISETILRFPSTPSTSTAKEPIPERQVAHDESPEVAARRAQLDLLGLGDPGDGPVEPARPAVLAYRSRGASSGPADVARAAGSGLWEASAREVAAAAAGIGVQNCGQCGLSLSANARFCRRCGTRQAQSA